jgi:hypothetical protein
VSEELRCDHCDKLLITVRPGRITTHGALSIRTRSLDGQAWVECPACGRETQFAQKGLGLQLDA